MGERRKGMMSMRVGMTASREDEERRKGMMSMRNLPSENTIYRGQRRTIHYTQHYFQASLLLGPELECLCSLRRHYHCSSPPRRRPPSFATRKNLRLCRNQC
ncbi:hypothetical protein K1719_046912 [Acacia pycnantha]|nr:hypothetical protein K1719_046912 [Acacia pycnantha]